MIPKLRQPLIFACLLLLLVPAASARRAHHPRQGTPRRISHAQFERLVKKLLATPNLAQTHWGISIVAPDGRRIYSLNDAQYFHPASNTKLFTTSTAFALLPQDMTFTTRVAANGAIDSKGTVHGDLVILGAGDPNISGRALPYKGHTERPNPPLAVLEDMADQIVRRGVHAIDGDIVGDDTWFVWEKYGSGWSWDDLMWDYGAPVSALTINDNVVYLNALPAAEAGKPAVASWLPATSYYTLENSLMTSPAGSAPSVGIDRQPGSLTVRLYGQTPLGKDGVHIGLAIEDPAAYAAQSLREMLLARGVTISGAARARHRLSTDTGDFFTEQKQPVALHPVSLATVAAQPADGGTILATHVSAPLGQDLVVTNKVSQNLHAELALRTLGKLEAGDGSFVQGSRVVRQFLLDAGVKPADFSFYDGSGLSEADLVTPRAITTLLAYDARQSWGAALRASLPVGGVDGTLADRFRTAPLKGRIFAKTGTLGEANALSGYMIAASGKTIIFSILTDAHLPDSSGIVAAMDKIADAIAESN